MGTTIRKIVLTGENAQKFYERVNPLKEETLTPNGMTCILANEDFHLLVYHGLGTTTLMKYHFNEPKNYNANNLKNIEIEIAGEIEDIENAESSLEKIIDIKF